MSNGTIQRTGADGVRICEPLPNRTAHLEAKRRMFRMADDYDKLAQQVEARPTSIQGF
jgi:hypothetical protein